MKRMIKVTPLNEKIVKKKEQKVAAKEKATRRSVKHLIYKFTNLHNLQRNRMSLENEPKYEVPRVNLITFNY